MRQAGVIRYLVVGVSLSFLAGCASFPTMRTSMPPPPAETAPAPAPTPELAQQVQNLEVRVQQLETQVAQLQGHRGAPAAPAKPRVMPAPPPKAYPKPAPVSNAAAQKYYTEGMRLYHAKKYQEARHQLYQYLKNLPRGPKAPEARYYLADSFYQEGKYREAAVEFNKLRLQFPKSILAPAALLRQALCYKSQRQVNTYRDALRKLVKAYPHSPEAKEAQKMLRESSKASTR